MESQKGTCVLIWSQSVHSCCHFEMGSLGEQKTGISDRHLLVEHLCLKTNRKSKCCIGMFIVDSADQDCGLRRKVCL